MIGRASSFLGLAFSELGIACAEVSASGDRRSVRRTAAFAFTAELSLAKPDAAGAALAAFLREKRFAASRVVAGVPARWLIATEKEIPPANEQQARAALQLQAERMGSGDGGEIVFDFAGKPNPQSASRVLLVGLPKSQLERVHRILDVAGLNIVAITSTGLATSDGLNADEHERPMLLLGPGGAEMVLRGAGSTRALRHMALTPNGQGKPSVQALGSELRRAVALGMSNGTEEMLLLDGVGLGPDQVNELSTRAGVQMRTGEEWKLLGVTADNVASSQMLSGESRPVALFAPAVSLALAGAESETLPVDFAHSRLAPAKKQRLGRNAMIGIAAAVLVVAGIILLAVQIHKSQGELDAINAQIKQLEERSKPAQTLVDRVTYAQTYFDKRPPALECLRQLTLSFKDDEKIWVTTFTYHADGKGTLQGKAADNETVLSMVERLKKNSKFSTVNLTDTHPGDTRTQEWVWSLNFTYNLAG